jgi:pimeloyl-ACP methyl ester carboxylesterase
MLPEPSPAQQPRHSEATEQALIGHSQLRLAGLRWRADSSAITPRLALHGWLDNAASMEVLLGALQLKHAADTFALDLPGHGHSAHTHAQHHAPFVDYQDALLDALDVLGWPQIDLIGHSMGGGIATLFAAAFPERVRKLVLLDSIGPLSGDAAQFSSDMRRGLLARRGGARSLPSYPHAEAALAARIGAFGIVEAQARPIVARGVKQDSDGLWRWRTDARLTQPSPTRFSEPQVLSAISAIKAPTLIVLATPRSSFLDNELCNHRLATFPEKSILTMPGNHHLHVLPSADLIAATAAFLA